MPGIVEQAVLRPDAPAEARRSSDLLKGENRYTPRPHVTIVHTKSLPAEQPLWDACVAVTRHPDLTANDSSIHISPMFDESFAVRSGCLVTATHASQSGCSAGDRKST